MWSTVLAGSSSQNAPRKPVANSKLTPSKVENVHSAKKSSDIEHIILDSGALISRRTFFNNFNINAKYYMTPDAYNEVRDKTSRQFLQSFPHKIIQREPSSQSIRFVSKWISRNSDYRSLSKVDRQIIALAHTIEIEINGENNKIASLPNKKDKKVIPGLNETGSKKKYGNGNGNENDGIDIDDTDEDGIESEYVNGKMRDTGVRLATIKKVVPFIFSDFMTMSSDEYGNKYGRPIDWEKMMTQEKNDNNNNDDENSENENNNNEKKENRQENENGNDSNNNKDKCDMIAPQTPQSGMKRRRSINKDDEEKLNELSPSPGYAKNIQVKTPSPEPKPLSSASTGATTGLSVKMGENEKEKKEKKEKENDNKNNLSPISENAGNSSGKKKTRRRRRRKNKKNEDSETVNEAATAAATAAASGTSVVEKHAKISDSSKNKESGNKVGGFNIDEIDIANELNEIASNKSAVGGNSNENSETEEDDDDDDVDDNMNEKNRNTIWNSMVNSLDTPLIPEKVTLDDAWNGEWLNPDNYQSNSYNKHKKKEKLKDVTIDTNNENDDKESIKSGSAKSKKNNNNNNNSNDSKSCVVCITIDLTMQRILYEMGIRVLTMSDERNFDKNNNNNNKSGNGKSEPDYFIFRCYACFQFEENTNRTHCRWCASKTYQRVGVYKDFNGNLHYRYYARDRFASRYMQRKKLVPRGGQLVKFDENTQKRHKKNMNQKKKKKRGYLNQQQR